MDQFDENLKFHENAREYINSRKAEIDYMSLGFLILMILAPILGVWMDV